MPRCVTADAATSCGSRSASPTALPKLIAYRLMEVGIPPAATGTAGLPRRRIRHPARRTRPASLDVVLTDRPAPHGGNLKVFSHALGDFEITLFGAPALANATARAFRSSLDAAPMLLPTRGNALRGQIDRWLETHDVRAAEWSANSRTARCSPPSAAPASASSRRHSALGADIAAQLGAEPVGVLDEVSEQYYAISNERRIRHPAVEAIRKAPVSWNPAAV
jgi:LysR family transcriptional activator of nhaA